MKIVLNYQKFSESIQEMESFLAEKDTIAIDFISLEHATYIANI